MRWFGTVVMIFFACIFYFNFTLALVFSLGLACGVIGMIAMQVKEDKTTLQKP